MSLELVTGYQGKEHVTAEQWADLNRGILGPSGILDIGNRMEVEIQTANQITVKDGVAVVDGRQVYIGYGESENIAIESGTQSMLRNDIVVIKYSKIEETGIESVAFEVVRGTPAESAPKDPVYTDMDIRTGIFMSQKAFCRVRINGTAIEGIDILLETIDTLPAIKAYFEDEITALNENLYFIKYASSDGSSFEKDLLHIDILNEYGEANKTAQFVSQNNNDFNGRPTTLNNQLFAGVRQVIYRNSGNITVIIFETLPQSGRIWANFYNGTTWSGWRYSSTVKE